MKTRNIFSLVALGIALSSSPVVSGQDGVSKPALPAAGSPVVAITSATTPVELARAALLAQGGEKFKNLKSMVLIGTVNLYPPNSTNSIPGQFVIAIAGARVRIEVNAPPIISFKQIFDGQNSYSSLPNVPPLPPPTKFGLPVLAKFDQPGYTVTALPDVKKQRGFRITDGDGNATDFYLDPATARVITFTTQLNGYTFATENKKMKEVDGVLVSYSFSQRLEMQQGAAFAEYNVKDVKLNQPIGDDVFVIPN
jgi:hypothetical protein